MQQQADTPIKNEGYPETLLDHALAYIALCWAVLVLHWITPQGVCSCGKNCRTPGKHPMLKTGLKEASKDKEQIKQWFKRWPDANIGVATGAISGIFVVDVDPKNSGDESLDALRAEGKKFPDDVMQITGSGGQHFFYKYPGKELGRSRTNVWKGIDIRGDGGYVVVAPSNHISGKSYFWDAESDPLNGAVPPRCPDFLLEKVAEKSRPIELSSQPPDKKLTPAEVKKIRAAMCYIPAEDRETWWRVGMSLHSTGAGNQAFGIWCEWSQQSEKFDFNDQRRVWDSFS